MVYKPFYAATLMGQLVLLLRLAPAGIGVQDDGHNRLKPSVYERTGKSDPDLLGHDF
jgi:hypothetical protein